MNRFARAANTFTLKRFLSMMIAHRNEQGGGTIGFDAVGLPEA